MDYQIPISQKYALTIPEASVYFNIGEKKLREIVNVSGGSFVLKIGKRTLIKRGKFEKHLDSLYEV